jgi:UDPglucose--hexose-1-phosphate uridylyltransferase
MKKNEIRKHYFQDKYVIISPKRGRRPHRTKICKEDEKVGKKCFFCPGEKVKLVYELPNLSGGWLVRVIKNIYPALSLDNKYAYGKQEIIIETPEHNKEIHELSIEHIKKILDVYSERHESLMKLKKVRYVLVFKNEGGKAGESINHAHSQVIALPMLPPLIREEILAIDEYQMKNNSCPYCDIIKNEKKSPRVAWEDKHIFALCPYASESPYGVWFIPKRHVASLHDMNREEKLSLARAMKHTISKIDLLDLSYNYFFHNSVDENNHHMIMKFAPRPNVWAGLELGTGIIINPIPPEGAAKFYRGKLRAKKIIIGR